MDYFLKDILPVAIDRVHFSKYLNFINFKMRKIKLPKSGRFGVLNMDEVRYIIEAINIYLDDKYQDKPDYLKARLCTCTTLNFLTILKSFVNNSYISFNADFDIARKTYQSTIHYATILPNDILCYGISKNLYPQWSGWDFIGNTPLKEAILDYRLYILVKSLYQDIWDTYISKFTNQHIANLVFQLMLEKTPLKALDILRQTFNLDKHCQVKHFTKSELEFLNTLNTKQYNLIKKHFHYKNAKLLFQKNTLASKSKGKKLTKEL